MVIGLYFNLVPVVGRDRLVVRTLRCCRSNPGSNPGHGTFFSFLILYSIFLITIFLLLFVYFGFYYNLNQRRFRKLKHKNCSVPEYFLFQLTGRSGQTSQIYSANVTKIIPKVLVQPAIS